MLKYFTLAIITIFSLNVSAQTTIRCITDEHYEEQLKNDPAARTRLNEANQLWQKYRDLPKLKSGAVYKIPVVVHVIHTYGPENISKAQIDDQIRILNEDFRRLNADKASTRPVFQPVAVDMEYEFVLATKDPQGNCTDGVRRIYSPLTNNARDNVKALSFWDSRRYLNIWVVKYITKSSPDGPSIILGFAQFPWDRTSKPTTDGIVVRADYFGNIGTAAGSNSKGRTPTHEVGHWLGLFHTFQGGCANPSWGEDIADTPPIAEPTRGCPSNANTCIEANDKPDQTENYMDYTNENCQNMYTIGQRNRADIMVSNYRSFMFQTENANFTGINVTPRPTCAPIADLSIEPLFTCVGQNIQLFGNEFGGIPTNYNWQLTGATPSSSTQAQPTVKYNQPGTFDVTLTVSNGSGSSSITRKGKVIVNSSPGQMLLPANFDFEFPNFPYPNWVVFSNDTTWKWTRTTTAASSGSHSLLIKINSETPVSDIATLTLPAMDLRGLGAPQLSFVAANARRDGSVDRLRIMASTDCGQSWFQIFQRAGASLESAPAFTGSNFVPTATQWRAHNTALTSLAGQANAMLRFDAQSDGGNNIYLDDIVISSATGTNELNGTQIRTYPNPSSGELTIWNDANAAGIADLQILSLTGVEVFQANLDFGTSQATTFKLPDSMANGMYIMRLTHNGETKTGRLVLSK